MKFSPLTLIILAGITIVGFVCGRVTAPQAAGTGKHETSVSTATATAASGKPVRSIAQLRDELKKLSSQKYFGSGFQSSRELFLLQERLDRLDASELVTLIEEYSQASLTPNDLRAAQLLFDALSKKDPETAWSLAATLQPPMRNSALHAAMGGLAAANPDAALAKLDGIEDDHLHRSLQKSLIAALAASDPSRALLLMASEQVRDVNLVHAIFGKWARDDMQAALDAFADLEGFDGNSRNAAFKAIANALALDDPAAAWEFALAHGKLASNIIASFDPSSIHDQIISQWAASDPQAALQAVAALEDGNVRNSFFAFAFRGWAETDYAGAFQYIMDSTDPNILCNGIRALTTGAGGVREGDHAKFFDALMEHPPEGNDALLRNTVFQLVGTWVHSDPGAAGAALARLPQDEYSATLAWDIARSWAQSADDMNEPLQWAISLPKGRSRTRAIETIFENWSDDPAAAAAAAAKAVLALPEADRTGSVLGKVIGQWVATDPQAATEWISRLPDPAQREAAIKESMNTLVKNDPQKAIEMLNTLGMAGNAGTVSTFVTQWASTDLSAAGEWVKTLPDGDVRDDALRSVAFRYLSNAPETATAWALAINDPSKRLRVLSSVVNMWKHNDAQSAEAWVEISNLPEESKNKLLGK